MAKYDINKIGRLEEITELRDMWENEARDFTPWLYKEGIEILSEKLGISIEPKGQEEPVGNYFLDIFAIESFTNRNIIIENQLEETNHDHLGKLITYASGKNGTIIIWIVKHARDEHRRAIQWLNSITKEDVDFFLVEIKLYRIGDSNIAPDFDIVEMPNEWAKLEQKGSITNAEQIRFDFWTDFNNYAFSDKAKNINFKNEFNKRKPSYNKWLIYSIGKSKEMLSLQVNVTTNDVSVDYEIKDESKEIFNKYFENKEHIEKEFGFALKWYESQGKITSKIKINKVTDFSSNTSKKEAMDWIIDTMLKFKYVFNKY